MSYAPAPTTTDAEKDKWVAWLERFGAREFLDSFLYNAQNALGKCRYCEDEIVLDVIEGGGVPDWKTRDGDYGCPYSPDTTEEGVGGHIPWRLGDY